MFRRTIQFLALLITVSGGLAEAKVKFNEQLLTTLTVQSGQSKTWNLRDYLTDSGSNTLTFGANVPPSTVTLPNFLEIVGGELRTKGAAPAPGTYNFVLTVVDTGDPAPEKPKDSNVKTVLTITPPPPAFKVKDLDLGVQKEGVPFTYDLKTQVTDPQFVKTYSAQNLPKWLSLDPNTGILSGTPKRENVGNYTFVAVASNEVGVAQMNVKGTVIKVLQHPAWTSNSIDLGSTDEGAYFEREASKYVTNPENLKLVYMIIDMTPPPWLNVGSDSGTLYGTPTVPKKYDVAVAFKYIIDGQEFTKPTTFLINVNHVNHAPKWKDKPIKPQDVAVTGVLYKLELKGSVVDPDGDELTFTLNGPAWGKIDPKTGQFSGTPGKSDVGTGEAKFQVTATDPGSLSDTTDLIIKLQKANEPPYWKNKPTILGTTKEDTLFQVNLSDPTYVEDPDGDKPLEFSADATLPKWLTLTKSGVLQGTPGKFDIGTHSFTVKVTDNKSGADITEVKIIVEHVNHAPYWTLSPLTSTASEDKAWSFDVAPYAKDDDINDKLTFSAIAGPSWAQLTATGQFSGTPTMSDVGQHTWTVRVADQKGATADVKVVVTVQHVNHPPVWKQPAVLANAFEDKPYTGSVAQFVTDPDANDQVRFVKVSQKPAWIQIASDGTISGKPGASDVGTFEFQVRALDLANAEAVGTVKITVEATNHPPYWRNAPSVLQLNDGYEDKTYKFDVSPYAADPDNDKLTFTKVSGPAWMFVGADGMVTGVPTKADIGNQTAKFRVSDPKGLFADTDATITIVHTNHPPVVSASMPGFEMKEREVKTWDLKQYINDIDADKLSCTKKTTGEDWVELTRDCIVKASPKRPQVKTDPWVIDFQVADLETFVTGKFTIKVLKDPQKPIWLTEPITFEPLIAEANVPFSNNIKDRAKDLDGESLKFYKKGGPAWLVVNEDGSLGGTPKDADLGMNEFKLAACNPDLCSDLGTLKILVKPGVQKDEWMVDAKVPNAPIEYMWDIDNSDNCDKTLKNLKANIGVFYDKLKAAELKHYGLIVSSDVKQFNAEPIRNKKTNDPMLLKYDANNLVSAWRERVELAYSSMVCNNCNNSPIWAMYRFFERLPNDFTEIYRNNYFMPQVPSDSMMVSHQLDHFKYYTKNLAEPLKSYTANDFARDFIQLHRKEEKSFRVSAIAPECPSLLETSGEPQNAAPANAYGTVVSKTGGKYYTTKCDFNATQVLGEFADSLIFRAYVHAKTTLQLTKKPTSVNTIKVTIGGVSIPSGDKWTYDAGNNQINFKWYLIDEGQLKKGDKIEIEYRIN